MAQGVDAVEAFRVAFCGQLNALEAVDGSIKLVCFGVDLPDCLLMFCLQAIRGEVEIVADRIYLLKGWEQAVGKGLEGRVDPRHLYGRCALLGQGIRTLLAEVYDGNSKEYQDEEEGFH